MNNELYAQNDDGWDPEVHPIKEVDTERCIEKLKQIGEIRTYPKGATISGPGAAEGGCFIILEGLVKAQVITEDGTENQYINHKAGYAALEAQCFCEWTENANFYTAENTKVIYLKRAVLFAAMEKDFELCLFFIGTLSMKFRWYIEHCRSMCIFGAMHRFCDLLIEMASKDGENKEGKTVLKKRVSQEELAMRLHVNRLTVIRCMKELRDKKLIGTENGRMYISDINALKKFKEEV